MNIFSFLLRIGRIPLLGILAVIWIVSTFTINPMNDSSAAIILTIIFSFVFIGWLYSAGSSLFLKANGKMKMSLAKFRIFTLYILIYPAVFGYIVTSVLPTHPEAFKGIIPFHLFAMFAILYIARFTAMALKTVEMKRQASFSDYGEILFYFWLIPLGIWKIQPRIQKALNIEPIF